MFKYHLHVQHDKGRIILITHARNKDWAKKIIMNAEGCPERAILKIKRVRKNK